METPLETANKLAGSLYRKHAQIERERGSELFLRVKRETPKRIARELLLRAAIRMDNAHVASRMAKEMEGGKS